MKRKHGAKQSKSKQLMGWRERTRAAEAPLPAPVHHQRCTNTNSTQQPNNPTTQRKQKLNSHRTTATGSSTIQQPNNKQTYKDLTNTQQPNSLHSKETTTNQQPRKLLELTENSTSTLSISRIKKEWSGPLKLRPPKQVVNQHSTERTTEAVKI